MSCGFGRKRLQGQGSPETAPALPCWCFFPPIVEFVGMKHLLCASFCPIWVTGLPVGNQRGLKDAKTPGAGCPGAELQVPT